MFILRPTYLSFALNRKMAFVVAKLYLVSFSEDSHLIICSIISFFFFRFLSKNVPTIFVDQSK